MSAFQCFSVHVYPICLALCGCNVCMAPLYDAFVYGRENCIALYAFVSVSSAGIYCFSLLLVI